MQALANRYGNLLREAGVMPEQRVIIALPDGPEFVAALFGILKIGAVVVMVNPDLKPDAIDYFFEYTRAAGGPRPPRTAADAFEAAPRRAPRSSANCWWWAANRLERRLEAAVAGTRRPSPPTATTPASGSSPAAPPAAPRRWCRATGPSPTPPQCYGQGVLGYTEDDVTLSVPKLFFGYAMGSNLFFPFAVGARVGALPRALHRRSASSSRSRATGRPSWSTCPPWSTRW